ncbi:VWA domain-containing protein, partial [candidate division WOR-3 bacterium]|nr:VWA domain-containing protein [candidate division WOR-3 bacterium]
MIRWGAPQYLWLLLLVPAGVVLTLLRGRLRRRTLGRAVDRHLADRLIPAFSGRLATLKSLLLLLGLAFLLLAASQPMWGEKMQVFRGRGIELVVALDASKSMLAQDVRPSRLERAKTELAVLLDELAGNAVGIVAFAGDARVMCPLTTDLDAARLFLEIISPEVMPLPGTDFGQAVEAGMSLFSEEGAGSRAIVLVTDGDDLGGHTPQAIQRAAAAGVRIYPVAFSTVEGAPVPESSGTGVVYKKDQAGNVVVSRMNERELIMMAQATGGRFLRMEGYTAARLVAELDRLTK